MRVLKVAVVPTRRGISSNRKGAFTIEDALKAKRETLQFLHSHAPRNVEFVSIDFLNDEGIMYDEAHAEPIAAYLKKESVDAIFILHCNFGCEEAVGRLCKMMKKPVFLWGARDCEIASDGSRSTDTQCGLFASSRLLRRYGVTYTYALNCAKEDAEFLRRFEIFLGAVRVYCAARNMRIGQINARPKYFKSVMINESALCEQLGIDVVPVNVAVVISKMQQLQEERPQQIKTEIESLKRRFDTHATSEEKLYATATLVEALKNIVQEYNLTGLAIECWTIMPAMLNCHPCLAIAELSDLGIPCCCETDIYGVIGSIFLQAAAGSDSSVFFGEYTMRSSGDDNTELIWHCGNAPYSLRSDSVKPELVDGKENFPLKEGDITIVRFDCDRNQFYLFADEAKAVCGPYTLGTYCWAKMDDWKAWEYKFMEGPYIHHVSIAEGMYKESLREACKYLPQLKFDCIR